MGVVSRLDDFLRRAGRFVSPRCGLIKQVYELCAEPDDARLFFSATEVSKTSRYGLPVDCFDHNGGAGLTRETALAAALGETIERYACSVYFPDDYILATWADLPERAVHPRRITPYSLLQYQQPDFPFRPFTDSTPVRWVKGTTMSDGEPIWYPAGLTHVPYRYGRDEVPIAPSVSTGVALALTPEDAGLSGLCEVVERDAVMIMWWNRLPAPEIQVPQKSWLGQIISERFTVPGVTFRLFDITTDIRIPTVFCVAEEEHDYGCAVACGAATRPNPTQAALKALIEAAQTRAWVRSMSRQYGPVEPGDQFAAITSFEEHVRLYGQPHMRHAIRFLTDHGRVVHLDKLPNQDTGDVIDSTRRCVATLQAAGLEPLAIDLTPADVAAQGLWAIKVAVPGMMELNGNHNQRFLGYQRLYEVPVRLGYRSQAATEAELNQLPHPFP